MLKFIFVFLVTLVAIDLYSADNSTSISPIETILLKTNDSNGYFKTYVYCIDGYIFYASDKGNLTQVFEIFGGYNKPLRCTNYTNYKGYKNEN